MNKLGYLPPVNKQTQQTIGAVTVARSVNWKASSRVRREVVIVIEVFENQWVIVLVIVLLVIERG